MYSQIFVPTRRYHSSSRLEASPFRRRRREPSERIYVYVCVCVRSLFFPSPIRRWNSFRGPTPSATFDCFDYPYLIPPDSIPPLLLLLLLSPFSFRDERLFASLLTHHPLPSRGDLSSGVQVPPPRKSGMAVSRFYSILG